MVHLEIDDSWKPFFNTQSQKQSFIDTWDAMMKAYKTTVCYPKLWFVFEAFRCTPVSKIKVVILGQDPYHNANQADGLSFSVSKGTPIPPSLRNIFKELCFDFNKSTQFKNGDLHFWAKQGVFLLNSILTVEAHNPLSHKNLNWQNFTDEVLKYLDSLNQPIVFVLWGNFAKSKAKLLKNPNHLIISSVHPSPLSAYHGFFGTKPFSKINNFLKEHNCAQINWFPSQTVI